MGSAPCFSCKLICWLDDCTKLTKITQSKGCQTKLSGFTVDVSVGTRAVLRNPVRSPLTSPSPPNDGHRNPRVARAQRRGWRRRSR